VAEVKVGINAGKNFILWVVLKLIGHTNGYKYFINSPREEKVNQLFMVMMLLWDIMPWMVRMSIPAASCSVTNVLQKEWKVMFLVIPTERIHSFLSIWIQQRYNPRRPFPACQGCIRSGPMPPRR
jgi:hypothetical protein